METVTDNLSSCLGMQSARILLRIEGGAWPTADEIAGKNVGGKCGEAVKLRFIVGMSAYVWLRVHLRARACERACVCECVCVCVRANDCVCSNADGCMGILWHGRRRRGGGGGVIVARKNKFNFPE